MAIPKGPKYLYGTKYGFCSSNFPYGLLGKYSPYGYLGPFGNGHGMAPDVPPPEVTALHAHGPKPVG